MTRLLLALLTLVALSVSAHAQLGGADTKPGDACTAQEEGYVRRNASADRDISEITLICNGSTWESATGGGLAALQGQDDSGPCTPAKDGLIRYRASSNPKWDYCDGGTTSWLPFKLPQCADDDTGECTLAALRSGSDPQFTASNLRCGSKLLGVTGTYGSGSAAAFTWADVTNANPSTLTATGTVSIGGIPSGCPAEVEVSGTGTPQVSVNGGAWGAGGAITNGQTLAVRLTSSATFGTTSTANVLIGSTSDAWNVTTRAANNCTAQSKTWLTNCTASVSAANHSANGTASITDPGGCGTAYYGSATFACADGVFTYSSGTCTQQTACDTTPNAFTFADVTGANPSTLTASSSVTISGINTATSVSATGGAEFRINGGSWVTSGTITNGQTLEVRLTSSASFSTSVSTTVTVGAVTDSWSVTTRAGNSCNLPWSGTIAHGASVTAYAASSVACGGSCTNETRTCNDGVLSGSYANASCSVMGCGTWVFTGTCVSASYNCSPTDPTGVACSSLGSTCVGSGTCSIGHMVAARQFRCQ